MAKKNNNRARGVDWERRCMALLRHIFPSITTSRFSSKETDDNGIDFCGTGSYAIQAKNTLNTPDIEKTLTKIPDTFHGLKQIKIIFWNKRKGSGKASKQYAIMELEPFLKLFKAANENDTNSQGDIGKS